MMTAVPVYADPLLLVSSAEECGLLETAKNLQKAMKTAKAGISKPATKRTPKVSLVLRGQQQKFVWGGVRVHSHR